MAGVNQSPRIRGARTPGRSGVLLGRRARGGVGDLQFITLGDLSAMGVASQAYVKANATGAVGFGFFEGGTMGNAELIGVGTWGHAVHFAVSDARSSATAGTVSTGTAVFTINTDIGGISTQIGTITFTAGQAVGVVAFAAPVSIPAGQQIQVFGPATADATLANVRAVVYATS